MITQVQEILRPFGITPKYVGCRQLAMALEIIRDDPDSLEAIGKRVYQPIAKKYHCQWSSVERNMRTLSTRAWNEDPAYLQHLAGYPLTFAPSAADFVEIISNYVQRHPTPGPQDAPAPSAS